MKRIVLVFLISFFSTNSPVAETVEGHVFISGKEFVKIYERDRNTATMLVTGLLAVSNWYSMFFKETYKLPMICLDQGTPSKDDITKATDHLYKEFKSSPEMQIANAPVIAALSFIDLFACR